MVHEDASTPVPAPGAPVGESAPELPAQRAPEAAGQEALFELPEQPAAPVEDEPAAPDPESAVSETPDKPPSPLLLGERERAVLDFERRRWKHVGAKEEAIRDELGMPPGNYFQCLNALLDNPAALAYNPTLVAALRRRREARRQSRQ